MGDTMAPTQGRQRLGWRGLRWGPWRVTPMGQGWLLTTGLLLGIGLFKNINLLALLGYAMLVVLALNIFLAGRRFRRLRGRLTFGQPVFAGAPATVEVRAGHSGGSACVAVRVQAR